MIIEASEAMHLVQEIPPEDDRKLEMMSGVCLRKTGDFFDLWDFARNAYRIGRETEAKRHKQFIVGALWDVEQIAIRRALEYCGNNPVKAAEVLGIGKTTMYRKLKLYGIEYAKARKEKQSKRTAGHTAGASPVA